MAQRMFVGLMLVAVVGSGSFNAQTRRPLQPDDIFSAQIGRRSAHQPGWRVGRLRRSTTLDRKEDNSDTDLYMVAASGGAPIRLTTSKKPENAPRWSPDGRYLAFLSARDGKKPQVFLLDRRGGDGAGDHRLQDRRVGDRVVARQLEAGALVSDPDPNDAEKARREATRSRSRTSSRACSSCATATAT